MGEKVTNETIRKEITELVNNNKLANNIIYEFWNHDAYNSILQNKYYFDLFKKYIQEKGTTFKLFEFYEYLINSSTVDLPKDAPDILFNLAFVLEQKQVNELNSAKLIELIAILLKESNITDNPKDFLVSIFSNRLITSDEEKFAFQHHTIQEFLAAKLILKEDNPLDEFKKYCILNIGDFLAIKPSWYGVIRFLLESDIGKEVFDTLIDITEQDPDNIDENFCDSLTSTYPNQFSEEQKTQIFDLILNRYKELSIWLPTWTASNLCVKS